MGEVIVVDDLLKSPEMTSWAEARMSDYFTKHKTELVPAPAKPEDKKPTDTPEAKVAESLTGTFKSAVSDIIPVGSGMFVAVFATELVDGALAKMSVKQRGGVELGIAVGALYAASKWGSKVPVLGKQGLQVVALLVAFDGIRKLVPIDTYAEQLATKVTGVITNKGLAQTNQPERTVRVGDYSSVFGGRR